MSLARLQRMFPLPAGASNFNSLSARVKEIDTNKPVILYNSQGLVVHRFGEAALLPSGELDVYVKAGELVDIDIFDRVTRFTYLTYPRIEP